jgi:hypothetical protein
VCVLPSCDPGTDGNVHGCDGPDTLDAPGICYDLGGGQGVCLPTCSFPADGSAPAGCTGKDVCNFYGEGADASGKAVGFGYCFGGCVADSDCPSGSGCEKSTGLCVTAPTQPALALGDACNASAQNPGCNCFGNPATGAGYCTQFCITGSQGAGCPAGYVCDSTEPPAASPGADAGLAGFATQTPGLAGSCLARCSAGGTSPDAGADGATADDAEADGPALDGSDVDAASDAAAGDGAVISDDGGRDSAATFDASGAMDAGTPSSPPGCPVQSSCSTANVAGPDCLP